MIYIELNAFINVSKFGYIWATINLVSQPITVISATVTSLYKGTRLNIQVSQANEFTWFSFIIFAVWGHSW